MTVIGKAIVLLLAGLTMSAGGPARSVAVKGSRQSEVCVILYPVLEHLREEALTVGVNEWGFRYARFIVSRTSPSISAADLTPSSVNTSTEDRDYIQSLAEAPTLADLISTNREENLWPECRLPEGYQLLPEDRLPEGILDPDPVLFPWRLEHDDVDGIIRVSMPSYDPEKELAFVYVSGSYYLWQQTKLFVLTKCAAEWKVERAALISMTGE